jgi:inner membrane protein
VPTFVSHAIVGLAAGKVYARRKLPIRFWVLCAVLPALADLDVAAFAVGIPYEHFFGHRGFFHSLLFGAVLGLAAAIVFLREEGLFSRRWWGQTACLSLICMTHPLLDAMTSGGLGIALFSPIDSGRYFFPWTPIQVAPIGIRAFFSEWGLRVLVSEILWVWIPAGLLVGLVVLLRRRVN